MLVAHDVRKANIVPSRSAFRYNKPYYANVRLEAGNTLIKPPKSDPILLARGYFTTCHYNMNTVKNVFVKVWEGKKFIKNRNLCVGKINSMSPATEKEKILSPLQDSNL